MDKLFVTIKRIVIPMLTALILVSSVAPAQALTAEDIRSLLAETPYITLEVPVATEEAPAERESVVIELDTTQLLAAAPTTKPAPPATLAGGYDNVLGWYPTAMLDNFPEMRAQVEQLFDVSSLFGQKTGILYPKDNQAASLLNFFATPNARYTNNYNYALTKMPELKAAASKTFTDIKGTEWFADKLVLSTYFGVIAGKPDGSNFKFDPNGPVTRAEFPVMIGRALWDTGYVYSEVGNWTRMTGEKENWFSLYFMTFDNEMFINFNNGLDVSMISKPMTRAECAVMINEWLLNTTRGPAKGEAKNYFTDVTNRGNMIVEMGLVQKLSDYESKSDPKAGVKVMEEMLRNPQKGVSQVVYDALANCYETKIIIGTPDHKSNWNQTVSRAEALQMVWNVMNYANNLDGSFDGDGR